MLFIIFSCCLLLIATQLTHAFSETWSSMRGEAVLDDFYCAVHADLTLGQQNATFMSDVQEVFAEMLKMSETDFLGGYTTR